MTQEHIARLESTVDQVKASTLNAKHLQQELSNCTACRSFHLDRQGRCQRFCQGLWR